MRFIIVYKLTNGKNKVHETSFSKSHESFKTVTSYLELAFVSRVRVVDLKTQSTVYSFYKNEF